MRGRKDVISVRFVAEEGMHRWNGSTHRIMKDHEMPCHRPPVNNAYAAEHEVQELTTEGLGNEVPESLIGVNGVRPHRARSILS